MIYIAGWNSSGFYPLVVHMFLWQEDARKAIVDELHNQAEEYKEVEGYDSAVFLEVTEAVAVHRGEFDTGEMPDGYNYFVQELRITTANHQTLRHTLEGE